MLRWGTPAPVSLEPTFATSTCTKRSASHTVAEGSWRTSSSPVLQLPLPLLLRPACLLACPFLVDVDLSPTLLRRLFCSTQKIRCCCNCFCCCCCRSPGVGSIGVASHLAPHLPGHAVVPTHGTGSNVAVRDSGAVAAAPFGSAGILPISWMYIRMLGNEGLKRATSTAILNANYMAKRLEEHFPIAFRSEEGFCAHEFIIDLRKLKQVSSSNRKVIVPLHSHTFELAEPPVRLSVSARSSSIRGGWCWCLPALLFRWCCRRVASARRTSRSA